MAYHYSYVCVKLNEDIFIFLDNPVNEILRRGGIHLIIFFI